MKFNVKNVLLFGGGRRIYNFYEIFKEYGFDVTVYTSPRRAKENKGIPFTVVSDTSDIPVKKNSLGISCGAGWIFKKQFIDKFNGQLLNAHGTPLPEYRGGGCLSWQIMNDDCKGICLIHQIDENVDAGAIVFKKEFEYSKRCKIPQDYIDELEMTYKLFIKWFIVKILGGYDFKFTPQNDLRSTYFPRLNTDINGYIDWSWPDDDIYKLINAFDCPYKGASTFIKDKRVFFHNVVFRRSKGFHPFCKGLAFRKFRNNLYICGNSGYFILNKILFEDKSNATEFINIGDRFYTPLVYIENAFMTRVIYDAEGKKGG